MLINPDDYPNTGGHYLEPGNYVAAISDVTYTTSLKGTEGAKITFTHEGQIVTDTFWLTRDAMFRLINLSKACGFLGEFTPEGLQGCTVKIRVAKEAGSDGKMYSRLADFGPVDPEGTAKQAQDVKNLLNGIGKPAKKSTAANSKSPDDEDPF